MRACALSVKDLHPLRHARVSLLIEVRLFSCLLIQLIPEAILAAYLISWMEWWESSAGVVHSLTD